jgi:single-stranded DNA-binding protein
MVNDWKIEGWVDWDVETKRAGNHHLLKFPLRWNDGKDFKNKNKIYAEAWNTAANEIAQLNIQKGERVILKGNLKLNEHEGKTYVKIQLWGAKDVVFPDRNEGNPVAGGNFNNQVDEPYTPF